MATSQRTTVKEANRIATDNERYVFEKELGEGSFATVFQGYDIDDHKPVAIKIALVKAKKSLWTRWFKKHRTPRELVDAKQEKDVLVKIQHKNVVAFERFYLFSHKSGLDGLAIVMEICERGSLQEHLEEMSRSGEKSEIDTRMNWYKQLAEGLSFIHSKMIVHRDLKPANILRDRHDKLKIADVGLAKAIWEAKTACNEFPMNDTYQQYLSTQAGTPPYMAPEVWNNHYQMSSDVFSLGLIFVVMSELPKNAIPIVRWNENNWFLGYLMQSERSVQIKQPTKTLRCRQANSFELKLFDRMLEYSYHYRMDIVDVITEVNAIEAHLINSRRSLKVHVATQTTNEDYVDVATPTTNENSCSIC